MQSRYNNNDNKNSSNNNTKNNNNNKRQQLAAQSQPGFIFCRSGLSRVMQNVPVNWMNKARPACLCLPCNNSSKNSNKNNNNSITTATTRSNNNKKHGNYRTSTGLISNKMHKLYTATRVCNRAQRVSNRIAIRIWYQVLCLGSLPCCTWRKLVIYLNNRSKTKQNTEEKTAQ